MKTFVPCSGVTLTSFKIQSKRFFGLNFVKNNSMYFDNHKLQKINVNHIYGLGNQRKNQRRCEVSIVYHEIHGYKIPPGTKRTRSRVYLK